jgi:hypothetical protein
MRTVVLRERGCTQTWAARSRAASFDHLAIISSASANGTCGAVMFGGNAS